MELREKAAALASRLEGRCTCATTDDGVDCPWCEIFYDVLQGHPVSPTPRGGRRPGAPPMAGPPRPSIR